MLHQFCVLFFILLVFNQQSYSRQCGTTTTFCPETGACCETQYSPTKYGCRLGIDHFDEQNALSSTEFPCCMPGPEYGPSKTIPNCLIIGDSVSIGYTPTAVSDLQNVCKLQHGPWDVSDGGACSTATGQACLDNFLVTQSQEFVDWDVILFNFGLHNLDNSTEAEHTYRVQLLNITKRLVLTKAKLIYALTTPFMPDKLQRNFVVEELNDIAREVVKPFDIQILDLYSMVTNHCGLLYKDCDWCRKSPCSYHYNAEGMTAQGHEVSKFIKKILPN